ncbi:MAG: hypothetical protein BMS9Abin17_0450 [Acidimicrobiia bacterium]|nr:MAG: hypothetical protein BMS9Abin17_0450 [Acidimicrobiia bacterium]
MDRQSLDRSSSDRRSVDERPSDGEEFEQIPWSSLVAEQAPGVDRRIYLMIGVVAMVVAVILGSRMIGGSTQPPPTGNSSAESSPPDPSRIDVAVSPPSTVGVVVSEADLMADRPTFDSPDRLLPVAFAEWFVTDYFTTDGSSETEKSVVALMSQRGTSDTQGLQRPPEGAYVEWARATSVIVIDESSVLVSVIFRTITRTDDGFVRDPVSAVSVVFVTEGDRFGVSGPPVTIPVPTVEQSPVSVAQQAAIEGPDNAP